MHPLWLNHDVFTLILEVFDKSSRRQILAALARTCRTMYEPSMDALWSVLSDVSPLVKCMPSNAWKVSKMPLGLGRQSPALFLKAPRAYDWLLFSKHAHRVRELSLCTAGPADMYISGFLLSAICAYANEYVARSGPLFPNLRTLSGDIYTPGSECLSCVPYLGGPALSVLRLRTNSSSVTVSHCLSPLSEVLARVRKSAPSLSQLEVSLRPSYQLPESSADFHQVMAEFPKDQFSSLILQLEFPKEILYPLSLGTRLTTLDISMHHIQYDDIRFDRRNAFPALQNLIFQACHINVATAFINAITTSRLYTLEMHSESFSDTGAVWNFCKAVARHQQLQSLAMYSMARFTVFTINMIPTFDMLEALEPLLALSGLESFTVEGVICMDVHDEYLVYFGKAWPHLRSLTLAINSLQPTTGVALGLTVLPTVHALRLITEYFPQLLTLAMPVSQMVSDPEDFRRKNKTSSALHAIHVYASPLFHSSPPSDDMDSEDEQELLDPDKLADYLHMLFPTLASVKGPPATGPWWPTVYSHLLSAKNTLA